MIRIFIVIFFVFSVYNCFAQKNLADSTYLIQFTDKNNTQFSVYQPEHFLSTKAIERRKKYNIPVIEEDLPVNQFYIDSLKKLNVKIHAISKWFNAISIIVKDSLTLKNIMALEFVQEPEFPCLEDKFPSVIQKVNRGVFAEKSKQDFKGGLMDYGLAETQISIHNGQELHNQGYLGQGILIGVLDAGFLGVNKLPAFTKLWENGQIVGAYDFVIQDTLKYNTSGHGTKVLSILGGYIDGELLGTAPEAKYWLMRTEDASSEYLIEEINWIVAAEKADSAGCEIITTSLGYADYDDVSQSYATSDLNGCTAMISIAADIASTKGMLVVCSAGNEGDYAWRYITAPADAHSILAVGAIKTDSTFASFSSVGPTADGRIKPDVVAVGVKTIVQGLTGKVSTAYGTSFACPIISGLAACLWQAHPEFSNMQLIRAIQRCSDNFLSPDSLTGYGIPDFKLALLSPDTSLNKAINYNNLFSVYPNPVAEVLNLEVFSEIEQIIDVEIFNLLGERCYYNHFPAMYRSYMRLRIEEFKYQPHGIYLIRVWANNLKISEKILKL